MHFGLWVNHPTRRNSWKVAPSLGRNPLISPWSRTLRGRDYFPKTKVHHDKYIWGRLNIALPRVAHPGERESGSTGRPLTHTALVQVGNRFSKRRDLPLAVTELSGLDIGILIGQNESGSRAVDNSRPPRSHGRVLASPQVLQHCDISWRAPLPVSSALPVTYFVVVLSSQLNN